MSLLPKKLRDKKPTAQVAPAWHPNFRNAGRLPDTKTVRTAFFINFGAVAATLTLLVLAVNRELAVRGYAIEIQDAQEQINKDEAGSKQAVELFGKYQTEEKKLRELEQFTGPGKFVFSDFLLHLAGQLPQKIALTHIEYRPTALILHCNAQGAPEEAADSTDDFMRQLHDDPDYGPLFEDISAANQTTDATTGWFTFDLNLKFKDTAPKEKKDKEDKK